MAEAVNPRCPPFVQYTVPSSRKVVLCALDEKDIARLGLRCHDSVQREPGCDAMYILGQGRLTAPAAPGGSRRRPSAGRGGYG